MGINLHPAEHGANYVQVQNPCPTCGRCPTCGQYRPNINIWNGGIQPGAGPMNIAGATTT